MAVLVNQDQEVFTTSQNLCNDTHDERHFLARMQEGHNIGPLPVTVN